MAMRTEKILDLIAAPPDEVPETRQRARWLASTPDQTAIILTSPNTIKNSCYHGRSCIQLTHHGILLIYHTFSTLKEKRFVLIVMRFVYQVCEVRSHDQIEGNMAVPLLSIPVKSTSEVDLVKPMRQFIKTTFSETKDDDYEKALVDFQRLRNQASNKFQDKHESAIEAVSRLVFNS